MSNHLDFIMALEGDNDDQLTEEDVINGFAAMIKDGTVWQLQGFYGRTAANLIEQGYINAEGDVLFIPEY